MNYFKRTLLGCVVGMLLNSGCGGPASLEQETEDLKGGKVRSPTVSAPTWSMAATGAHTSGVEPSWSNAFAVSTTYQVFFATIVTGTLPGHHTQSVFLFDPQGNTYIRYDVPFATDVAAGPGEQQAEKTANGWRVWVSLPVAGTMISQQQMVGTWTAAAYVDGASVATASVPFTLY